MISARSQRDTKRRRQHLRVGIPLQARYQLDLMYKYPTPPATPYPTISGVGKTDTSIWSTTTLVPWPISLPWNHWDVVTMEPFPGGGTDGPATLGSDTLPLMR